MSYILMGSLAFILFIVYDINSVTSNYRLLRGGFLLGCLLLAVATAGIISLSVAEVTELTGRTAIFSALACIFLALLVYTLFFAIPFKDTYIKSNGLPVTCSTGVYALSRHPGVLWFTCCYFFLWLALPGPLVLAAAILFSLLNLFYIILQDRWIFMKIFADYADYKRTTPFLIPNFRSLRRCVRTFRRAA